MRKRILSLALVLAACLSLTVAAQAATSFTDVPANHWAYAEIQKCCDQGIVNGYTNGTFGPKNTVTGAQFTAMLTRMFYPAELAANDSLSSQGWYLPALQTAYSANLLTGTSRLASGRSDSWKSSANLPLNRYDMAQILNNLLASKNVAASSDAQSAAQDTIKDWSSIPSQYRSAVRNCYALGVLNGMSDQSFSGSSTMNRAQACVVINRTNNNAPSTSTTAPTQPAAPAVETTHTLTIQYKKEGDEATFQPTHTSKVKEGAAYSVTSPTVAGYTASQAVVSGTMGKTDVNVVVRYKPTATAAAKTPEQLSAEVVTLVNAERAKQGLAPLGTFSTLTSAAQVRAPELVKLFEHTRPNGSTCFTALDQARVSYYTAGENIAAGSSTAEGVMQMWMNSPGHKANILHKDFTHIGVACVKDGGTYYWVQMFVGSNTPSEGSGTTQTPTQTPVSLEVSPKSMTLTVGETASITASTNYSSASISYSSSSQSVATVSSNGVVTAKKAGTATITVSLTAQGKRYTAACSVTVKEDETQTPQTPQQPSASKTPQELSAEVVALVNAERAKQGLAPLGTLSTLTAAAEIRAPELIKSFEHTRPDGRECFTALDEAHVANVYLAGENIAAGSSTAEGVMQMWMNSPGHRGNILHKDFTHIGVACVKSDRGYFWVQMFISTPNSGSSNTTNPGTTNPGTTNPGTTNPSTPSQPSTDPSTPSNPGTDTPSSTTTTSRGVTCTALPANGRTTHYREEWRGQYMDLQISGNTITFSGCCEGQSPYNYVVLSAFGYGNTSYTPFRSGVPFSISVQIDVDALNEFYGGDASKANSYVSSMICQNYTPGDTAYAGYGFQSGADVMLALDGNGGMEFYVRQR